MRTPLAHHVTMRLADERVIARDAESRRRFACIALHVARRFALIAFRCADNHNHLIAAEDERTSLELARRIEIATTLGLRLPVGFEPARARPIHDQWHLANGVRYCFAQERRHGTDEDPLFDASNLPDLLGMRVLRAPPGVLREYLPRMSRPELLAQLGVDCDQGTLELHDLADAAAAAYGLGNLGGNSRLAVAARRAALHAAKGTMASSDVAQAIGMTLGSAMNLQRAPCSAEAIAAVQRQMRARAALRTRVAA
jgi:hypothetical protein